MKLFYTILLLLTYPVYLFAKSKSKNDDVYEIIMNNIRNVEWQSIRDVHDTDNDVEKSMKSILPDGSWQTINYASHRQTAWEPVAHLKCVHEMAIAYTFKSSLFFGNNDLYNDIVEALQFWYDADPRSSNWFNQQIFAPKEIGEILILLRSGRNKVPQQLENDLLSRMAKIGGSPDGQYSSGGSNRINIASHWIFRGCLQKDSSVLNKGIYNYLLPVMFCKPGGGLQPDFSYQEHGNQLYIGNYGYAFVQNISEGALYLRNTPYALTGEQLRLFSQFVIHTYLSSIRGSYYSFSIPGRQVANKNTLDQTRTIDILSRMILIDPDNTKIYEEATKRCLKKESPSFAIKPSHKHYWRSNYTMHIRPDYYFDVRFVSNRTLRTENVNNEDKKGFFLSDGATNMTIKGDEYLNIFPVWDWCKIPGVTAPLLDSLPNMKEQVGGLPGEESFCGGVSDSLFGADVYNMNYTAFKVKAKKSWFYFDNEIVCLGANINSANNAPVATTVNQCLSKGIIILKQNNSIDSYNKLFGIKNFNNNLQWVIHNGFGYYFPQGGNITVSDKIQNGNWLTISESQKNAEVKEDVFSLWINHGEKPSNASYAYIIVPDIYDEKQMEEYEQHQFIKILANNDSLQAVSNNNLHIAEAIFYKKNVSMQFDETHIISVSDPAAIMIRDNGQSFKINVSDPTQQLKDISIMITDKAKNKNITLKIKLPEGEKAGSSCSAYLNLEG